MKSFQFALFTYSYISHYALKILYGIIFKQKSELPYAKDRIIRFSIKIFSLGLKNPSIICLFALVLAFYKGGYTVTYSQKIGQNLLQLKIKLYIY
jgi:hypothetical protein